MTFKTYRYWKVEDTGSACIVAACEVNKETKAMRVGYAFCSPREKNFTKAKARQIADGRLSKAKSSVAVALETDFGISEAIDEVVFDLALKVYINQRKTNKIEGTKGRVPRWVCRAVEENYPDMEEF